MCICDDLMTVCPNHIAHTYLFQHRNFILVATRQLQELVKSVHLGDLFFFFFKTLFDECPPIPLLIPTYFIIEIGFW